MDLEELMGFMYVSDYVDENLSLKEECPMCKERMNNTYDNAFPYYCPRCEIFVNKDKSTIKKELEK